MYYNVYLKAKAREKDKAAINFNLIFLNFPKEPYSPPFVYSYVLLFQLKWSAFFMLNA